MTLGDKYIDSVTRYSGTATARTVYLGGHVLVRLERADSNGKPEEVWFPEQRLEPFHENTAAIGIVK